MLHREHSAMFALSADGDAPRGQRWRAAPFTKSRDDPSLFVNVELHQAFPECIQHESVFVAGDTAAANKMFKTRCRHTPGRCKLE